MVPITRLEAETEICDIKIQITDFFEELISHEYEAKNRKPEGVAMDARKQVQVQFQATA